jgi:catechol 2,3-dioxygenase-like lactoylglutathione lyase family enzyme
MAGVLGGRFVTGGSTPGYTWTRLRFANGFMVDGFNPEGNAEASFLAKFLARSGVGPHHLTFVVEDLDRTIEVVRDSGIEPLSDAAEPGVREAFLRPADAHGIVVHFLEAGQAPPDSLDEPEGFPPLSFDHPMASLGRVVHAVADLQSALGLFKKTLGGRVVATGSAVDGNHWVELAWDGAGRLRLLEGRHAEIAEWIGDRPGRLRHLFFNFDEPEYVPGATKVASGRWVVQPDDVLGTRLVLASSAR